VTPVRVPTNVVGALLANLRAIPIIFGIPGKVVKVLAIL
jgi:hypothetical protein